MKWIVDDRDGYKVTCSECGAVLTAKGIRTGRNKEGWGKD